MLRSAFLALNICILTSASARSQTNDEVCVLMAKHAETIMRSRQSGASLTGMLEIAHNTDYPGLAEIGRALVISAFEVPRFNSDEVKQQQINDFRDKVHLACIKRERWPGAPAFPGQ